MSITYELLKDKNNWSYIFTVDIDYRLSKKDKDIINKITSIVEQSIKILNYES